MTAPFEKLDQLLPDAVREVVARDTPIPRIALRAAEVAADNETFVRADIGQISGYDPDREVLYGPPVGIPELRAGIAELYELTFGVEPLTAKNVAVTTGAAEGLSLLFRCFAHERIVGLPRGHWENYANGVTLAGGRAVVVDFFDADGRLDVGGMRQQIGGLGVNVVLANFPCNPTGAVLSGEEAAEFAELCRELDLIVVADEVYSRLRFDGHPPVSMLQHLPERAAVVSSASKEYLIPGARVGYVICAAEEITDRVLRKLIRANTASPNVLGQRRLLELIENDLADLRAGRESSFVAELRDELQRRARGLVDVLKKHGFELVGRPGHDPMGTIFLMAGLPEWWSGDDAEFVERAIEQGVVSSIPGSAFGIPGAIRLSFGGLDEAAIARLDDGLGRLEASS